MTALLAEGRLSREKMKEVGLVPVLVEYLVHPHELLCRSMLVDPAELALSVSLLPHTYPSFILQKMIVFESSEIFHS